MKVNRPQPAQLTENVLPMINVVFLLLIFFMLAGALRAADVFEITPLSSNSTSKADPLEGVFLIDGTGRLALNGSPIEQDEIEATITQHLAARPNKVVRLKADAGVPTTHIIRLMAIARDAGAERIALLTLKPSK